MTFNIQKARDEMFVPSLKPVYLDAIEVSMSMIQEYPENGFCVFYKTHTKNEILAALDGLRKMPAALDEIERLQAENNSKQRVLDGIAVFLEDRGLLDGSTAVAYSVRKAICDQAKRIAELEKEIHGLVRCILTDDEKDVVMSKQRAALKKLGQAKRERGKALVEERAQWNAICRDVGADPSDRYCTGEGDDGYPEAREQLRREGKI